MIPSRAQLPEGLRTVDEALHRTRFRALPFLGPAFIVSPGLLQKIYGARDDRAVRLGVGMNALGLLLYAGVPPLMGMIARARFPELPNHDRRIRR